MLYVLTNAPATFCNLMNDVFYDYIDQFVVVYLDCIVIYSGSFGEHLKYLRLVFTRLREHTLYVKKEKCEFCYKKIKIMGHIVSNGIVRMDQRKVHAILDWTAPTKVAELRIFLGLTNYCRKVVAGNSKNVAPLMDLLKKN